MGWTTVKEALNIIFEIRCQMKILRKLAFCEHEWFAQLDHGDIFVKLDLFVVVGVLRLAADSVAHLSVRLSPVVVPGPHRDI